MTMPLTEPVNVCANEVADADNEATECSLAENSFPVKVEAQLNEALVNERQRIENFTQHGGANAAAALKHHVDPELF